MSNKSTFCVNCANLMRGEPSSSPRYDMWYNMLCKASPLEESISPITGEIVYIQTNDFGKRVESDKPYDYCRNVNNGSCRKFYPASE